MARQEIEKKISSIISDILSIDIKDIDESRPLLDQHGINDYNILDLLFSIVYIFGPNIHGKLEVDIPKVSIEDLFNLIERKAKF